MEDEEELLLPVEAAKRLGVHVNTIRNWMERGVLKAVVLRPNGYRRVRASEVRRVQQFETEAPCCVVCSRLDVTAGDPEGGGACERCRRREAERAWRHLPMAVRRKLQAIVEEAEGSACACPSCAQLRGSPR